MSEKSENSQEQEDFVESLFSKSLTRVKMEQKLRNQIVETLSIQNFEDAVSILTYSIPRLCADIIQRLNNENTALRAEISALKVKLKIEKEEDD